MASFSLHCSATLYIVLSIWLLLFWLTLPDEVHKKFASMTSSELPAPQLIEATFRQLSVSAMWTFVLIQAGGIIHLLAVMRGASRAAIIALSWKKTAMAVPVVGLAVMLILVLLVLLSSEQGLRSGNLPQNVRLTWLQDSLGSGGLKRTPLLLAAEGRLEKRSGSVALVINRFTADNRALSQISIQAIECSLGVIKNGIFEWPFVMHQSRVAIDELLSPGQSLSRSNLDLDIPLDREFRSGATVISCFVITPAAQYPLGNGKQNILAW